jgi:tRNA pseudouridine38-40 synthase
LPILRHRPNLFNPASMRAFKLIIEYDGTEFVGWQSQINGRAVQDEVIRVLGEILQEDVTLIGSGRTDSGVHARGQVAGFRTASPISAPKLLSALNGLLPRDICVHSVEEVSPAFNARFDARLRRYRYFISRRPSAVDRRFCWYVSSPLDIPLMQAVARRCTGAHDFSAFCTHAHEVENRHCTVSRSGWAAEGFSLIYEIVADRFVHGMVRSLVGTMVDIGRGKIAGEEFDGILASGDRRRAGSAAPARGLFLEEVGYQVINEERPQESPANDRREGGAGEKGGRPDDGRR